MSVLVQLDTKKIVTGSRFIAAGVIKVTRMEGDKADKNATLIEGKIDIQEMLFSTLSDPPKEISFKHRYVDNGFNPDLEWDCLPNWKLDGKRVLIFAKPEKQGYFINWICEAKDVDLSEIKKICLVLSGMKVDLQQWLGVNHDFASEPVLASVLLRQIFESPVHSEVDLSFIQKALQQTNSDLQSTAFQLAVQNIKKNRKEDLELNGKLLKLILARIEGCQDAKSFWSNLVELDSDEFYAAVAQHPEWGSAIESMVSKTASFKLEGTTPNEMEAAKKLEATQQNELEAIRKRLLEVVSLQKQK